MNLSSARYLLKEGFKNIFTNHMMSLASVAVLVSCLIITGSAALFSLNVKALIESVGDDSLITVYLKPDYSDSDSVQLGTKLSEIPNIQSCQFHSRTEVLESYRETLGDSIFEAMQGEGNPFGNEYKVQLSDLSQYQSTVNSIMKMDGVDTVSDRSDVAQRLTNLNHLVTVVGMWLVLILAVITLFIISNTIKMTMYTRRFEISIMKSVGATNAFIRIPFVIESMTIGLFSGILASVAVIALYEPVRGTLSDIIDMLRSATIPLGNVWLPTLLCMSGIGITVGLFGGFIAVNRHLNKEGGAVFGT